jgi:hypothetical protein
MQPSTMDALMFLNGERDKMLCEAFKIVNEKKAGYIVRRETQYINSAVSNILFSAVLPISASFQHPQLCALIQSRSLVTSYRVVIPFYWEKNQEWLLVIVDNFSFEIHFVFAKYANVELCRSSFDEREAFKLFATERILEVLQVASTIAASLSAAVLPLEPDEIATEQQTDPLPTEDYTENRTWKIVFQDPHKTIEVVCHRTPREMEGSVFLSNDSGLYVAYAVECDYFDAPIYTAGASDWTNIRKHLAYCILNSQSLH